MKDDYLVISKKRLESWLSDCRSNPENFMSGYLYEFGRSGFETLDLLKSQLERAEEVIRFYANKDNWEEFEGLGFIESCINQSDYNSYKEIDTNSVYVGGKKAREYFSEKADK